MTHPLTDEMCGDIAENLPDYNAETCMRAAANWQLEQVLAWLDKNLDEYTTDTDPGFFYPMSKLPHDLNQAMRP